MKRNKGEYGVCAMLSSEKAMAPTPVHLPGKSHGQRSLVGYSLQGRRESDMTEQLTLSQVHIFQKNNLFLVNYYFCCQIVTLFKIFSPSCLSDVKFLLTLLFLINFLELCLQKCCIDSVCSPSLTQHLLILASYIIMVRLSKANKDKIQQNNIGTLL